MSDVKVSKAPLVVTEKNFGRVMGDATRSIKSMRDKFHALVMFAALHYAEHGNTLYLTKILQAVIATPGINTRGMQAYIQEACNVRWVKDAKGDLVFKKITKEGDNPAIANSNVLATPWYQWVKENVGSNNASANWTMEKYAHAVIAVLNKHEVTAEAFAKILRRAA